MKPQKIIMVLDTETASLEGHVYDVGFTITNRKGEILFSYNALVREVFTDARLMMGAFYARKMFTHYPAMLTNGDIEIKDWLEIVADIRAACRTYGVTVLAAYNLAFDRRVMAATNALYGDGKPIFKTPVSLLDIWRFCCETKLSQANYKRLAYEKGWVSDKGNIKTGAENSYRYITGNWEFIEDHTALSDAMIETVILAACYASKKRIPYNMIRDKYAYHPWKIVNDKRAF